MDFCQLELLRRTRIRVNTDLNLLTQVLVWFDQFNHPIIPQAVWLQCQLALAEGFTNAVRHAHDGKPPETPIDIEVTLRDQAMELRIWDCGSGFDLDQLLNTMPQTVDQNAEGGRGLKIIEQTADVFRYIRTADHRNCLVIIKHYSPAI
jgi:serine/threonine-protein kinase RsbW